MKKGIYAPNFGGVRWTSPPGKFVFSARGLPHRGWQDHRPIRERLIGNGPGQNEQVPMVGNDPALDRGVGVCGRRGRRAGRRRPAPLKLDQLTVGGTQ